MKATIFGAGYVGLVQAAVLAEVGHDVVCVDIDERVIDALKRGEIPIYEPGLENLIDRNISEQRLRFTNASKDGVDHGDILFIAVGTPTDPSGHADLTQVISVASDIASQMADNKLIIIKSTVPVGSGDVIEKRISDDLEARGRSTIGHTVVSNPEFLKQGSAVSDCMRPDRIIVGTNDAHAETIIRELYAPFNRNREKIIIMDRRSAEMTKYAANCMLATKISFINEMAAIADELGADIEQVRKGIGSDPRIGYDFIYPGIGYGGSCFPKDVKALVHASQSAGLNPLVLNAVAARNDRQKQLLFDKIHDYFDGDLQGKVFALWGLAFKPNTNDMREAPSRVIMEKLWAAGAHVQAFDPKAAEECARLYGDRLQLVLTDSKEAALDGADALIVATEWKVFQAPNFDYLSRVLKHKVIFDGRNIYDPESAQSSGLDYISIGRQTPKDTI